MTSYNLKISNKPKPHKHHFLFQWRVLHFTHSPQLLHLPSSSIIIIVLHDPSSDLNSLFHKTHLHVQSHHSNHHNPSLFPPNLQPLTFSQNPISQFMPIQLHHLHNHHHQNPIFFKVQSQFLLSFQS